MLSASDTGKRFKPAGPFNLDGVLNDSLGIHTGGPVDMVELLFKPAVAGYAQEHFWHDKAEFTVETDGGLRLKMRVALNPELEMKIQRWGSKVEVIGPPELRRKFVGYAREAAEMYGMRLE